MCTRPLPIIRVTLTIVTRTIPIGRIRASVFMFPGGPFSTGTPISAMDVPLSATAVLGVAAEPGFTFPLPTLRVSGQGLIPQFVSIKVEAGTLICANLC